jgi:hypothetical protein
MKRESPLQNLSNRNFRMAKKKAKSQAKASGLKLPAVLKTGWLDDLLHSDLGRRILADALVAAAGAAAVALTRSAANSPQIAKAADATVEAGSEAASAAKNLVTAAVGAGVEAVSHAADALLPSASPDAKGAAQPRRVRKPRQKKDEPGTEG